MIQVYMLAVTSPKYMHKRSEENFKRYAYLEFIGKNCTFLNFVFIKSTSLNYYVMRPYVSYYIRHCTYYNMQTDWTKPGFHTNLIIAIKLYINILAQYL